MVHTGTDIHINYTAKPHICQEFSPCFGIPFTKTVSLYRFFHRYVGYFGKMQRDGTVLLIYMNRTRTQGRLKCRDSSNIFSKKGLQFRTECGIIAEYKFHIYPWHSWIARQTPTLKVEGSNPFGQAKTKQTLVRGSALFLLGKDLKAER